MDARFALGIELLNGERYYQAHDVLEEVWREVRDDSRPFYQGIVQIAIAMHHFSTGNLLGARSVLEKSRANLADYPAEYGGIDLRDTREQLQRWHSAMGEGGPYPPAVRIRRSTGC